MLTTYSARHREPVSEVAVERFTLNAQAPHSKALGENTLQHAIRKCGRTLKCNNFHRGLPRARCAFIVVAERIRVCGNRMVTKESIVRVGGPRGGPRKRTGKKLRSRLADSL
jgi:hypothetical protein